MDALIDDFQDPRRATNGQRWRYFSDRVMGGVSDGGADHQALKGRQALRLQGDVSLENNGGFIQVSLDLAPDGYVFNADAFEGIAVTILGDGGGYALNLRTTDLRYPWQSYRAAVATSDQWQTVEIPFSAFEGQRTDRPLNLRRLRRLGLISVGEARAVDVALSELRFYGSASAVAV